MGNSKRRLCLCLIVLGFIAAGQAQAQEHTVATEKKPLIQMAILLDTSGSMSGLIDQARAELWAIVNKFIFVRKDGRREELRPVEVDPFWQAYFGAMEE